MEYALAQTPTTARVSCAAAITQIGGEQTHVGVTPITAQAGKAPRPSKPEPVSKAGEG